MRKSGALSLLLLVSGTNCSLVLRVRVLRFPEILPSGVRVKMPMIAMVCSSVLVFEAPDAASMAPPGPEGSRTAPFRAAAQRRTGADGYFASRCKGASRGAGGK